MNPPPGIKSPGVAANLWQRSFLVGSGIVGITATVIAIILFVDIRGKSEEELIKTQQQVRSSAKYRGESIDANLKELEEATDEIAEKLSNGELTKESLPAGIKKAIWLSKVAREIGAAFVLFDDPRIRLHGIAQVGGQDGPVDLDSLLDYSREAVDWYHRPLAENKGVWMEPVYDATTESLVSRYATPFYSAAEATPGGDRKQRGVIYALYSHEALEEQLDLLDLGETAGYSFIVSKEGRYIVHPNEDYIDGNITVLDVTRRDDNERMRALTEDALIGKRSFGLVDDPLIKDEAWVAYESIPSAGWSLGVVSAQKDVAESAAWLRARLILITLLGMLAILCLASIAMRIHRADRRRLWAFSWLVSLLCLVATGYALFLITRYPDEPNEARITNHSLLAKEVKRQNLEGIRLREELPLYVPTGIYVQSCTFISAEDVRLTGYVWQKYFEGVHDAISRGFLMPESESSEITETYAETDGGIERRVWKFSVVLHQKFDYSQYPFGSENIWVQLWHKDFIDNVILIPDLDSYKLTNPESRPGLLEGLEVSSWGIEETFFSYRDHTYQTNFGTGEYSGLTNFPELYFNIIIRKELLGPFVSHILPLGIVFLLLFTIIVLSTHQEKKISIFGFDTLSVIATCAGFFLVVIFSHADLRKTLEADRLVYLELYYFLVYIAILLVALNSLLFTCANIPLFRRGDNFIPRLLYWPGNLACILLFTLLSFYL